ncbi:MAG: sodium-dependent transporter [Acidobacteria bacterium]|jgi:neurotransmitter:Na+ symporter, NSS family|nr:sodium-dependent transporter [Acidobacteriota bacterium]
MAKLESFSSRWGVVLAGLGMAVGTGNMWRFPRIAAENGGAAFLIPWFLFLFIWSIPLLIAEFAIGRGTRRGAVGAFATLTGGRFAWMGGFVAVVTVMILFYYSVVTGWTLRYLVAAMIGDFHSANPQEYWDAAASGWQAGAYHVVSALVGAWIIQRGVVRGIEAANRVLVPALFVLLIISVVRAVSLPGAERGLEFLFNPDLSSLTNYKTWLEALTQSAWSTGAGWGLILTFGIYLKKREDVVLNSVTIGFGDNSASLLAGLAMLPVVFAILSLQDAHAALQSGNEGLMFIWVPQLFERMAGGGIMLPVFFLALACAALSSLIAMIELAARILMDSGMARRKAVRIVTAAIIVVGMPSALNLTIFKNQDWVWGVGLMISGLFISLLVTMYGSAKFLKDFVNVTPGGMRVGRAFELVLKYLIPAQFVVMFGWWMYTAATEYDSAGWWNPDPINHTFSVGTCVVQWAVALTLLMAFNKRIAAASTSQPIESADEDEVVS